MTLALPVTTFNFLLALASCLTHLPSLLSLLSILSNMVLASLFSPLGDRASLALARCRGHSCPAVLKILEWTLSVLLSLSSPKKDTLILLWPSENREKPAWRRRLKWKKVLEEERVNSNGLVRGYVAEQSGIPLGALLYNNQ